jgi:hypothetical protein
MVGVANSLDEAGYTAWPLFKESGLPAPMIWEGKKGEPSKPVMPLDLKVRPILDGNYIVPKTIEYIKRNAAAKTPFFVYVGYSEVHPPVIGNPDFVGKSDKRGGLYADIIGEMDHRVGQIMDALQGGGRRRQHHRDPEQRQRERRRRPARRAWVKRALAWRFSQYAVRGQHEGAGHSPMAGHGPGRRRHE